MTAKPGFASNRYAGIFSLDHLRPDYRIDPALRQRVASQYPPDRHQTTSRYTMSIDRFHGVLGARRHIPARGQKYGRDSPFVSSKQEQRDGFGKLVHLFFRKGQRGRNLPSFARPDNRGRLSHAALFSFLQRLLNYFKCPADLVPQFAKFKFEHGLLGIDYHIHRSANSRPMQTN